MKIGFTDKGWVDYHYWQENDKKLLKKINKLIEDIQRNGNEGIGHPEPLRHELSGYWSRKITDEHRLVYQINEDEILISQCRFHY